MTAAQVARTLARRLVLTIAPPYECHSGGRFRPQLEMLDARALPASLTWTGGGLSSSFHDAGNWTASDAPYQRVPVGGDDVYFSGTNGSNDDCTDFGLLSPGGTAPNFSYWLNSIHLIDGYTGTLTLAEPQAVETLVLDSGAIAQPATTSGTEITVYTSFVWTGGILNSDTAASQLIIAGGAAAIAPDGNTLISNSTIRFDVVPYLAYGSSGTIAAGTVEFGADTGIDVMDDCILTVNGAVTLRGTSTATNAVVIADDALLTVIGSGTFTLDDMTLSVLGTADLQKPTDAAGLTLAGSGAILQDADADVTVTDSFSLFNGTINGSASGAHLIFDGAIGEAGNGLTTGSPLAVVNGADATFLGTTTFNDVAGVLVDGGDVIIDAAGATFAGSDPDNNVFDLPEGGFVMVEAGYGWTVEGMALDFHGGVADMQGYALADVLSLSAGEIMQASDANITVYDKFEWTGGILNNTENDATLFILGGADNLIEPNEGTLITGSTIEIEGTETNQVEVKVNPGSVNFTNAAGATVGAWATLRAEASVSGDTIGFLAKGAQVLGIRETGKLLVTGPGSVDSELYIVNMGGTVDVKSGSAFYITGNDGGALPPTGGYFQVGDTSETLIENQSTISCKYGFRFSSGSLRSYSNANLSDANQYATLVGKVTITGGSIQISTTAVGQGAKRYGKLLVQGDMDWTAGVLGIGVDDSAGGAAAGISDKLYVYGTVTAGQNASILPHGIAQGGPPANSTWGIVFANTFVGGPASLPQNSPWQIGYSANPTKRWNLTT